MTDDIGFKIFAAIDGLKESMGQASKSVEQFAEHGTKSVQQLNAGFKALKELTEAYLALLAVEKIEAFFDKFAEQATQINRLGLEFGIGAEKVQELQFAMRAAGGSGDQLQSLLSRLSVAMEKAIDNAGPQRKAFQEMGISLQFLKDNANNVPAVMDAMADAVQRLGAGSQVTATLIPLMGRGAANIVPALAGGSAGLKEMADAAKATGGVMDELQKDQFEELHKSVVTMEEAFNGFGAMIASAFEPAFKSIIDGITEFVSALNGGEEHVSLFRIALLALVVPIDAVVLGIAAIKTTMVEAWQIITTATDGIYYSFKALGLYLKSVAKGDFKQANLDWDATMKEMDDTTHKHVAAMKKELDDLGKTAANMGKGIAGLVSGAEKPEEKEKPKAKHNQTSEELAAAQAAAQEEKQLAMMDVAFKQQMGKQELQNKKDVLAAGVAAGTISKQQEIDALKDLANQEYEIEHNALMAETQINGQTVVEKQKLYDQIQLLYAKHQGEMSKLNLQSVQAQQAQYKQLTDTITHATDSMLSGVLQGTQTWQQAVGKLFSNLAITFVESLANMGIKWAVMELGKTAATVTGNAARTASNTAAATEGLAVQAVGAQKSVGMSAGQAAASVYADVAAIPYIGWLLAPPAAAAAFVAVEAFGAGFSASGGFDIPTGVNPVTQLHQREMVLPAELADKVRGMTGGGNSGGDTHLHVHAVDGESVRRLFMDNGDHLAAALKRQMRNANQNLANFKV